MKNLLLITRRLRRDGIISLVNLVGLSLGMTVCILIAQFVHFEYGYNSFHENRERIARVLSGNELGEIEIYSAPGFATLAREQISGIASTCRVAESQNLGNGIVEIDESGTDVLSFREDKFAYADGNFFTFFSFPLVNGNARSLEKTNVVFLSSNTAKKYFGEKTPMGKTLVLNNQFGKTLYTVAGVFEAFPANSDLQYELVFSLHTLSNPANLNGNEGWASMDGTASQWVHTYILAAAEGRFEDIAREYTRLVQSRIQRGHNIVFLQGVEDMHLGRSMSDPYPVFGSLKFVYVLVGLAIIILVIGWFNYINLSTANALRRAKDVGVRKLIGATRLELIFQFIGEAVFLNLLSLLIALGVSNSLQYPVNFLLQRDFTFNLDNDFTFWITCASLVLIGSIVSGIYTAFTLTSFKPISALKGNVSRSGGGAMLRKTLVVLQFSTSAALIVFTLTAFD